MSIHDEIAALHAELTELDNRERHFLTEIVQARREAVARVEQLHQVIIPVNPTPATSAAIPPVTPQVLLPAGASTLSLITPPPQGAYAPAPVTPPMPAPVVTGASTSPEGYHVPAPPAPVAPVPPAPVPPVPPQAPQAAPQPPGQAPPPPQLGSPPQMPSDPEAQRLIRELTS